MTTVWSREDELAGAWCNADVLATSVMEAVSFMTPEVERFLMLTVAQTLVRQGDAELARRSRSFLREEAKHARLHARLNRQLSGHLGGTPPGLALLRSLLRIAGARLSLPQRLSLVAALEHASAVLSEFYLGQAAGWQFASSGAQALFAMHAREELAHCQVAFDLSRRAGWPGRPGRTLTMLLVLVAGLACSALIVPWIAHRRTGARWGATLRVIAALPTCRTAWRLARGGVARIFGFARREFDATDAAANARPD